MCITTSPMTRDSMGLKGMILLREKIIRNFAKEREVEGGCSNIILRLGLPPHHCALCRALGHGGLSHKADQWRNLCLAFKMLTVLFTFFSCGSIKSSWNISVVKFLLEKLKQELVTSPHNYTDKELKGEKDRVNLHPSLSSSPVPDQRRRGLWR